MAKLCRYVKKNMKKIHRKLQKQNKQAEIYKGEIINLCHVNQMSNRFLNLF